MSDFDRVLREAADAFVMTVAVVAEREERNMYEVAREALNHALARLTENGSLIDAGEEE